MLKWIAIYLAGLGCTPACQAAVIGHFQVEVGASLNPCTDRGFTGLAQLGYDRRRRFLQWAGRHWCDPETQMRWYVMEMRQMGLWQELSNSKSVDRASQLMAKFEGGQGSEDRLARARAVYQRLPKPAITFSCASC